jgi:dihydrofolate synthase / folylpolyglutamate synthase
MEIIEYGHNLSYYEKCVLLAFLYFRDQACEYVVLEVGMGGRLDATNIVTPILSIITSISYDHMGYLGDTLEKIAYEK